MDNADLIASVLDGAAAGTSVEKVHAMFAAAGAIEPPDEESAMLLSAFQLVASLGVLNAIPQDPDQLDDLLGRGALLFMRLRSDDAPYLGIVAFRGDVGCSDQHPAALPVHIDTKSAIEP